MAALFGFPAKWLRPLRGRHLIFLLAGARPRPGGAAGPHFGWVVLTGVFTPPPRPAPWGRGSRPCSTPGVPPTRRALGRPRMGALPGVGTRWGGRGPPRLRCPACRGCVAPSGPAAPPIASRSVPLTFFSVACGRQLPLRRGSLRGARLRLAARLNVRRSRKPFLGGGCVTFLGVDSPQSLRDSSPQRGEPFSPAGGEKIRKRTLGAAAFGVWVYFIFRHSR